MPFVLASSITSDLFLTVIVNVPPADDEQQTVRVPKAGEQVKRRAQARWQSVCSGTTIGRQHSALSQETPLIAVVPKPSEPPRSATMRTKSKETLISQTCNNAYKGKKGALISQTCP